MFCPADLAARIDQAEARQMIAIANGAAAWDASLRPFIVPVGRGAAIYAGPGSPTNKMIGIGFGEALDAAVLDDVEARFAACGTPVQAEVSVLAEPAVHAQLAARGYRLSGFEHVLGHPLGAAIAALPEGVAIDAAAPSEVRTLGDVMVEAFASPDVGGVGGDAIPPSAEIRRWFDITMSADGFRGYVARVGGAIAGGGSMRAGRRRRAVQRRRDAAALPPPRRADGAAPRPPHGRGRGRLHHRCRRHAARLEVAAERPARRLRAALRPPPAREACSAPGLTARRCAILHATRACRILAAVLHPATRRLSNQGRARALRGVCAPAVPSVHRSG